MFLTAFSQLVSRICHPHPEVFKHLKNIIAYMLLVYSQQSLWMLMPVYKVSFLATCEVLGAFLYVYIKA
jgi:serine/threonine-protein kinase ATR